MNINQLEQSIADERYQVKHFSAPNIRKRDNDYIDVMEKRLDELKRHAGIGEQLPLWLPINPYNKVPVFDEKTGRQSGWIF